MKTLTSIAAILLTVTAQHASAALPLSPMGPKCHEILDNMRDAEKRISVLTIEAAPNMDALIAREMSQQQMQLQIMIANRCDPFWLDRAAGINSGTYRNAYAKCKEAGGVGDACDRKKWRADQLK